MTGRMFSPAAAVPVCGFALSAADLHGNSRRHPKKPKVGEMSCVAGIASRNRRRLWVSGELCINSVEQGSGNNLPNNVSHLWNTGY